MSGKCLIGGGDLGVAGLGESASVDGKLKFARECVGFSTQMMILELSPFEVNAVGVHLLISNVNRLKNIPISFQGGIGVRVTIFSTMFVGSDGWGIIGRRVYPQL